MAGLIDGVLAQGQIAYAMLWDEVNGIVYNGVGFVSYNQSDWATYAIPLTEKSGSGFYTATFPVIAAGLYRWIIYVQLGGTPAAGDTPIDTEPFVTWDGTKIFVPSADVNVAKIDSSTAAAQKLRRSADSMLTGAAAAGTLSTTQMTTTLTNAIANSLVGRIVIFTSGTLINQATNITAYNPTGGKLTFSAVTNAPLAGDTFVIV